MKRKIYDGVLFFNELDLLEIRLNVLNDVVDKFIIVEADVTHQGAPKNFIFEENKERFSKFLEKISYIKVTNMPKDFVNLPTPDLSTFEGRMLHRIYNDIRKTKLFNPLTEQHFGRDFFQKECIKLGMELANDSDILLSADLDEIPDPEYLRRIDEYFEPDQFYTFNQTHYCYYLNMIHYSHLDNSVRPEGINTNWKGTRMGTWGKVKEYSINELRAQNNNDLVNSGWHFSWLGGVDRVKNKLQSYSHKENNQQCYIDVIDKMLLSDDVIYDFKGDKSVKVVMGSDHPEWLVTHADKFKHLIK
jgi:beta-1,4-mannosyl-glycoprotein beta-1,4-N-acetylglucosaminyltransferase